MKVNVWYSLRDGYYRFASLYDECNYCYATSSYSLDEAKTQYIIDHEFEGFDYNFIEK